MFGANPTCIDYIYYQELLTAMILSGNGTENEFMASDTAARLYKVTNLTKWYRKMAQIEKCKKYAEKFKADLKSKGNQDDRDVDMSSAGGMPTDQETI